MYRGSDNKFNNTYIHAQIIDVHTGLATTQTHAHTHTCCVLANNHVLYI